MQFFATPTEAIPIFVTQVIPSTGPTSIASGGLHGCDTRTQCTVAQRRCCRMLLGGSLEPTFRACHSIRDNLRPLECGTHLHWSHLVYTLQTVR